MNARHSFPSAPISPVENSVTRAALDAGSQFEREFCSLFDNADIDGDFADETTVQLTFDLQTVGFSDVNQFHGEVLQNLKLAVSQLQRMLEAKRQKALEKKVSQSGGWDRYWQGRQPAEAPKTETPKSAPQPIRGGFAMSVDEVQPNEHAGRFTCGYCDSQPGTHFVSGVRGGLHAAHAACDECAATAQAWIDSRK